MKIAVASDDERTIASHFGRTRGFVIFEVENIAIIRREYRANTFTGHARGLEGTHLADHHGPILDALSDCGVVISHGMGRRIYDDLTFAGKEVFVTAESNAVTATEQYLAGHLRHCPELACDHRHE
jgi:predicted Fe-Mo cluster-binding NifX family protein